MRTPPFTWEPSLREADPPSSPRVSDAQAESLLSAPSSVVVYCDLSAEFRQQLGLDDPWREEGLLHHWLGAR